MKKSMGKNYVAAMFAIALFVQPIFAKIEPTEAAVLEKALKDNNIERFQSVLAGIKKPFDDGYFKDDSLGSNQPSNLGSELLKTATEQTTCRDPFVKLLVEAKAKLSSGYGFADAIKQGCPQTVEMLSRQMTDAQMQGGAMQATKAAELFLDHLKAVGENEGDEQKAKDLTQNVMLFANKAKEKCPSFDAKNSWCSVLDEMKDFGKRMTAMGNEAGAQEAAEKQRNTPSGLAQQICETNEDIRSSQAALDREKRVGRTGGVVDAELVHDKASELEALKDQKTDLLKRYKAASGKPFSGKCK